MTRRDYRHLSIVRHRVRRQRAPFLLIMQHHDLTASTCLAAPLVPPGTSDRGVVAPQLSVDGETYAARILDLAAYPYELLGEVVASADADRDAIRLAVDTILNGDNYGRAMLR